MNSYTSSFQYLHLPLEYLNTSILNTYTEQEHRDTDSDLIEFIQKNLNKTSTLGEKLDQEALEVIQLGERSVAYRRMRRRKILSFRHNSSEKIQACLIANRTPLGLDNNFRENRAYFILDESLDQHYRAILVNIMSEAIKGFYEDSELELVPILTDKLTSKTLQHQGAKYMGAFVQNVCFQEGESRRDA